MNLTLHNLSAGYGLCNVIEELSAEAKAGQFIALLGPNGGGKSTLIKTIAGLITPNIGTVLWNDISTHTIPIRNRARNMAYLAQDRIANDAMSVRDIVRLGRAPFRGALGQLSITGTNAVNDALIRTQSNTLANRQFGTLSGGEKARCLLARALCVQAPLLLVDEPIAALDPYYQLTLLTLLKEEASRGTLVIAALHDLALAHHFADTIWVIHQGKMVTNDTADKALSPVILSDVFGIEKPKGGWRTASLL